MSYNSGIYIVSDELESIQDRLRTIEQLKRVLAALESATVYLVGILADYPPERHEPQPFKTDKSRRYFFYALEAGLIDVPYKRGISPNSQDLKHRWTTAQVGPLAYEAGNNAGYGPYVQDAEKQTAYHKATGWLTIQDVEQREREAVLQFLRTQIQLGLNESS